MCNLAPGSTDCMWATKTYTCPAVNKGRTTCITPGGDTPLTVEYIAVAPRYSQQQEAGMVTLTLQQQQARIAIGDVTGED